MKKNIFTAFFAVCALFLVSSCSEPDDDNSALMMQVVQQEATEKVPITAFLSIFSVTLFKNYRKRTLKILRSEVFQWPRTAEPGKQFCV